LFLKAYISRSPDGKLKVTWFDLVTPEEGEGPGLEATIVSYVPFEGVLLNEACYNLRVPSVNRAFNSKRKDDSLLLVFYSGPCSEK